MARMSTSSASAATIPIIDIGPYLRPPKLPEGFTDVAAAKATTARDLRLACETWGFFYVKNHGADDLLVEKAHEVARR